MKHIYKKERQKKVDERRGWMRDAPCGKGERGAKTQIKEMRRRTERRKDIMKAENTFTLQTFEKSQCLIKLETTKSNLTNNEAEQSGFHLNGRYIRVIGTSLDPSTLSGQKRLFIVKDCFHPAKDCTALTVRKQLARTEVGILFHPTIFGRFLYVNYSQSRRKIQ